MLNGFPVCRTQSPSLIILKFSTMFLIRCSLKSIFVMCFKKRNGKMNQVRVTPTRTTEEKKLPWSISVEGFSLEFTLILLPVLSSSVSNICGFLPVACCLFTAPSTPAGFG